MNNEFEDLILQVLALKAKEPKPEPPPPQDNEPWLPNSDFDLNGDFWREDEGFG